MPRAGEVKEVVSDGRGATFEWTIPDSSRLEQGYNWLPHVTYFDMEWELGIYTYGDGFGFVWLHRKFLRAGSPKESVHFSIQCKTSDGEERDVAREQTFPADSSGLDLYNFPPCRIPPSAGITLTCSLWKVDATGTASQTEGASCSSGRKDEHVNPDSQGVSRETQTEDGDGRSDGRHSADMQRLRQKFQLWLQQPQEGDCIRILRPEHFRKRTPSEQRSQFRGEEECC